MIKKLKEDIESERSLLSPPGDTIQETIDHIKMTQAELAERMGKPKEKLNDIIKGREPVTTETAYKLSKVLGIPANFWLNRESNYRSELFELKQKEQLLENHEWLRSFPVNEMSKLGWMPYSGNLIEKIDNLLDFFGIASPEEWYRIYLTEKKSVAFRLSLANTKSPYAISAWLRKGEIDSERLDLNDFDKAQFSLQLKKIRELADGRSNNFIEKIPELCAESGVAVVYTENLPKAPVNAAARRVRSKPLIQLTDRFKTDDVFWFNFFHEAAHILLHNKKDIFLENLDYNDYQEKKEKEADRFAEKIILNRSEFNQIANDHPINERKILEYAEKFKLAPGIIVGRLQHKKVIKWNRFNDLKKKIDISK